jgi:Ca2+-binding EF-hand superfamily protein
VKNELLELFQAFDKNEDCVLSKEEIYEGYKSTFGEVEAAKEVERIMYDPCSLILTSDAITMWLFVR